MFETPYDVIVRPLITEKSVAGSSEGKYSFRVHTDANKVQIKDAIGRIYEVKVTKVNTLIVKPKPRRRGGKYRMGHTPVWKKAVVTLAAGNEIKLFESNE